MKLSKAVETAPWGLGMPFVVDSAPGLRPEVVGNPPDPETMAAALCEVPDGMSMFLACKADDWDHAYSAAHELAESRMGHTHTVDLFELQAELLAHWCVGLACPPKRSAGTILRNLIFDPPAPRVVYVPVIDPRGRGMRA